MLQLGFENVFTLNEADGAW